MLPSTTGKEPGPERQPPFVATRSNEPDPIFQQYATINIGSNPQDATAFLIEHGDEFTEEMFINMANRWEQTVPYSLLLIRAFVGNQPFTPAALRRLKGTWLEDEMPSEMLDWLAQEDQSLLNTIRTIGKDDAEQNQLIEAMETLLKFGEAIRSARKFAHK